MRDPARIARILSKLSTLWRLYPDWRLGQLVANVTDRQGQIAGFNDVFNIEDDKLEARIDEVLRTGSFAE
jgi:hypothetical protein